MASATPPSTVAGATEYDLRPRGPFPAPCRVCTRCVIDDRVPGATFDAAGVCNHCQIHDRLAQLLPVGPEGDAYLERVAQRIRAAGRGRRYDCIVGFSGGRDTSYCLVRTVQLGLRPLAVHFDNGWDSAVAKRNIRRVCGGLGVDLHCVIADWNESRELTNCTIRGSVPYIDLTDDVGIVSALYRTASAEGVRYIIHSHSYRTEGINPLRWNYCDARFTRSLIRQFARQPLTKFQNTDLHHFAYWILVKRIRVFTMTNYYNDADPAIDEMLTREFGWEDTGGWHFDNEIFGLQCWYARHKFGIDWRQIELAALVREGLTSREHALAQLQDIPAIESDDVVAYALRKQGITPEEWQAILAAEPKFFTDYPTYYPLLRALRLPIKLLCRMNILPPHAYEKYFDL